MNVLVKAYLLRRAQLGKRLDAEAETAAEELTNEGLLNRSSTFLGRDRIELTPKGQRELSQLREAGDAASREVVKGAVDPLPFSRFMQISGSEGLFGFLRCQQKLNEPRLIHDLFRPRGRFR